MSFLWKLLIVDPGRLLPDYTFRIVDNTSLGESVIVNFATLTDILFRLLDLNVTLETLETLPLLNSNKIGEGGDFTSASSVFPGPINTRTLHSRR